MGRLPPLTTPTVSATLAAAYHTCRRITAHYGRTYFLATRLLPADRRPAVHALYGFARLADEIVDQPRQSDSVPWRAAALDELERRVCAALDGGAERHPVLLALADTVRRYRIRRALFVDFLHSMRMDLTVTDYATFDELARYMHGSAGVIGLQLLPVLGIVDEIAGEPERVEPMARALGDAFQLTNFLRDVGEDLDRGRVYLPADELGAFGVDRARLEWARSTGRTDRSIRRALAHLTAVTYSVYRAAEPGIALLRPESRPCVRTASTLYRGILDEIVAADYAVLTRRVAVPGHRRLAVALPALVRALRHRRGGLPASARPTPGRGA